MYICLLLIQISQTSSYCFPLHPRALHLVSWTLGVNLDQVSLSNIRVFGETRLTL